MKCSNAAIYGYLAVALIGALVLVGILTIQQIEVPSIVGYVATTALGALVMAARPGDTTPPGPAKDTPSAPASAPPPVTPAPTQ